MRGNKKINIKTKFLLTALFGLFFPFAFASASLSVKATDTIAGYSAALKSSVGTPGSTIVFVVEKPEGGTIRIEEKADETGVARADFLGFHTKKSGKYSVIAFEKGESEKNAPVTNFEVFADTVSTLASKVELVQDAAPADGVTPAKIRVTLRDRHGNPVKNHFVDLISSRADDTIEAIGDGVSDDFGEIIFHIFSREVGVAHFSAFDRNAGLTLDSRAKVVFFEPEEEKSMGGSLFAADIFGNGDDFGDTDFGPVDHFLVDFPDKVEVGSDSNFLKITAVDKEGRVAKDYTGKVIISTPDDENATLPGGGEYQFSDRDQGERQFDLALIFSKTGSQQILVNDFEDGRVSPFIKGEKTVEVVDECLGDDCSGNTENPNPSSGDIEIKTPADGGQYGNANISLSGKARPNTNLKVFLDDKEVDLLEVDTDGLFVSEISEVSDGDHTLFLQEVSASEVKSSEVSFLVDTTPPALDEIGVYPTGAIEAGGNVSVTIFSEANLDAAIVRVAGTVESFIEDKGQPGKYEVNFSAPQKGGQFGLSVSLTDKLKNTATFSNAAKIEVSAAGPILPAPKNLTADPGDASAFVSWDPVKDDAVAGYRVFSGTNDLFLKSIADLDAMENSILLENLTNDEKLFVSVAALSTEGREGLHTKAISVTPNVDLHPAGNPEDEPKRVTATPLDGKVLLSWEEPEEETSFFDIRFGISSGVYMERFLIPADKNEVVVPDLINDLPYFFTVAPLTKNAVPTGEKYMEVRAIPNFSGRHPAPLHDPLDNFDKISQTGETGASAVIVFLAAIFLATAMFFFQKSRRQNFDF